MTSTRPLIVVGIDGSEASKDALAWAAHQAQLTGSDIQAVLAWSIPAAYGYVPIAYDVDYEGDAGKEAERLVDEVLGIDRAVTVTATAIEGHPAKVLVDAAQHASMLVVGSSGHGAFAGRLLGSVSENCARHATCPVVIVRHPRG